MRKARPNPIPPKERIAVGREDAAHLLSISPGHFDKLVAHGKLPQPRLMNGRLAYVVRELEESAVKLPHRGEEGYDAEDEDDCPEPEV